MKKYPKILSLGHDLVADIFNNPVEISEKIDGSQCRIHLTEDITACGSKNTGIADMNMFGIAHEQTQRIWNEKVWMTFGNDVTLFTEFLNKEKHNVLVYDRVPLNNLYLFGAIIDDRHLQTEELIKLANELQIEPPNILASEIKIGDQEELKSYLTFDSVLGGTILEGVVIKGYHDTYPPLLASTQAFFSYPLASKLVRDDFKERLHKEWGGKKKKELPINKVTAEFFTEARFHKSVQHLDDEDKIEYEMKDLKVLIPEFYDDLLDEEKDEIAKVALEGFWAHLRKKSDAFVVKEWKKYLLEKQFNKE